MSMALNAEPDVRWLEGYEQVHFWPMGVLIHPDARQCAPEDVRLIDTRTGDAKPLESAMVRSDPLERFTVQFAVDYKRVMDDFDKHLLKYAIPPEYGAAINAECNENLRRDPPWHKTAWDRSERP